MISSTILTLVVIPAVYGIVKGWRLAKTAIQEQPYGHSADTKAHSRIEAGHALEFGLRSGRTVD